MLTVAIPAGVARASGMPVEVLTESATVVTRAIHSGVGRVVPREPTERERDLILLVAGVYVTSGPEAAATAVLLFLLLEAVLRRLPPTP